MLKKSLKKVTGNLSIKCEFCGKKVKRKVARFEKVKKPHLVHPKKTAFCSKKCLNTYNNYTENIPKSISLCSSCPVPRALVEKSE